LPTSPSETAREDNAEQDSFWQRAETWLVLEIGAGQQDLIRRLIAGSPFRLVEIRPDYAGHPRIALLRHR